MERGYSKNTFARRGDCWKVNKNKHEVGEGGWGMFICLYKLPFLKTK